MEDVAVKTKVPVQPCFIKNQKVWQACMHQFLGDASEQSD
jgi:hypothetical protein